MFQLCIERVLEVLLVVHRPVQLGPPEAAQPPTQPPPHLPHRPTAALVIQGKGYCRSWARFALRIHGYITPRGVRSYEFYS